MAHLVEVVAPRCLGLSFRWLLSSSWLTNLGDGLALAAGPLLVASLTDEAFLIALGALLHWLPPLLFALHAGVVSDRLDRRRLVVVANLARAGVLSVLCVTIVTGSVSVTVALLALFVLGTAEVYADNTSQTLLPSLVGRDDLAIANARLQTGFFLLNRLAGPPLGAALFAAGTAWPFATQAVLVAFGAVLVWRIVLPAHDRSTGARIRHEIADGIRWVRQHAAVRTLVLTIFIFNLTFGAAWSVLVLYASERLGLGPVGFGLITTVEASGGLLAAAAYGRLIRRISLGGLMRIGLVIETLTHLVLAVTTSPWVAMPVFFVFGAHTYVWSTTSTTIRQRAVPIALQGRVTSVNTACALGGLVIGAGIGGILAQLYGVTAPFWYAFVGSAIFLVLIWRSLTHLAHDEAATT